MHNASVDHGGGGEFQVLCGSRYVGMVEGSMFREGQRHDGILVDIWNERVISKCKLPAVGRGRGVVESYNGDGPIGASNSNSMLYAVIVLWIGESRNRKSRSTLYLSMQAFVCENGAC